MERMHRAEAESVQPCCMGANPIFGARKRAVVEGRNGADSPFERASKLARTRRVIRKGWTDVPDDVWTGGSACGAGILSFLDLRNLFAARRVCRDWLLQLDRCLRCMPVLRINKFPAKYRALVNDDAMRVIADTVFRNYFKVTSSFPSLMPPESRGRKLVLRDLTKVTNVGYNYMIETLKHQMQMAASPALPAFPVIELDLSGSMGIDSNMRFRLVKALQGSLMADAKEDIIVPKGDNATNNLCLVDGKSQSRNENIRNNSRLRTLRLDRVRSTNDNEINALLSLCGGSLEKLSLAG